MQVETRTAIALTVAVSLLSAVGAAARDEVIRWRQDTPTGIAGYELEWGTSSGSYGGAIDLSLPPADADGVYTSTVSVPDGAAIYMVLHSYDGSGLRSPPSNEIVRFDGSSPTPTPTPDPDPTPTPDPDPTPTPDPDPDPAAVLTAPGAPYLVYP